MKSKKKLIFMVLIITFTLSYCIISYASNIGDTKLFSGTKTLLTDITTALTGLIAGTTGFLTVKNCIAWNTAEDEDKPRCKKRVISTIGIGILGTTITGVLAAILAYYS